MAARIFLYASVAAVAAPSEWGYEGPPTWNPYQQSPPPPPPQQQPPPAPPFQEQQQQQQPPMQEQEQEARRPTLRTRSAGVAATSVLGFGLSKATTGIWRPRWLAWGALANGAAQAAGGRFGELAHATSLTAMGASWRLRELSRSGEYPVFRQLKAATGLIPRRPFPPDAGDDPWRYRGDSPAFSMVRCVLGAVCLAGIAVAILPQPPLIPTSLLAILTAAAAVFSVTLRDARGDAARCLVARAVAVTAILWTASKEARLAPAAAAALRLSGDRLSRLDKRFGLSNRLGAFVARFVTAQQATSSPQQQQPPSSSSYGSPDYGPPPPTEDPLGNNGGGGWAQQVPPYNTGYPPPPPQNGQQHYRQQPPPRGQDQDWPF